MPDARLLREITDALRVLTGKADQAGSTTVRSILTMTAEAVRKEAERAERAERGDMTRQARRT